MITQFIRHNLLYAEKKALQFVYLCIFVVQCNTYSFAKLTQTARQYYLKVNRVVVEQAAQDKLKFANR